jgi:hypothetical protein
MPAGRRLNFKLYIEGVEVPFVQIVINATANQPSQAQIAMVPTDSIFNIRPRSLVHVFFFDDYIGPEPFGKTQTTPIWRLLWEGEVMAMGFNKTPSGRSFNLQCADMSNYWASCKTYFLSGDELGWAGADRTLFVGSRSVTLNLLDDVSPFFQKFMVGKRNDGTKRSFPEALACMMQGFTDDLVYWETLNNRVKLSQRIGLVQDDNAADLMRVQQFERIVRGMYGNLGGRVSMLDLVNHLKQLVYYSHIPVVAPPFLPVDSELSSINICPQPTTEEAPLRDNLSSTELRDGEPTLLSFLFKPQVYMSLPPRCNVFFPDIISSIGFQRNFMAEYTRAKLVADHAIIKTKLFQSIFIAPSELAENLKNPRIINDQLNGRRRTQEEVKQAENLLLFKPRKEGGEIPYFMTEEEYEKGIIPLDVNLPYAKYSTLSGKKEGQTADDVKKSLFENMAQVAEYQLQLARVMARTANVSMEFNPWCVLNFPCAIFDSSRSFFANISNITHHINSTGGAFTTVDCSMAREMIIPKDEEIVALPKWLNEKYHPQNVHGPSGTYAKLFGCDALGPTPEGQTGDAVEASAVRSGDEETSSPAKEFTASRQFNLAQVANKVYQLVKPNSFNEEELTGEYDVRGLREDTYAFAETYRRRNIATIQDIFGTFYDLGATAEHLTDPPKSVPVGSPLEPSTGGNGGFDTGGDVSSGTPFDYRPLNGRVTAEGEPGVNRSKATKVKGKTEIRLVGNLSRPGHKRDALIEYRRETTELRALDGR